MIEDPLDIFEEMDGMFAHLLSRDWQGFRNPVPLSGITGS